MDFHLILTNTILGLIAFCLYHIAFNTEEIYKKMKK